MAITGGFSTLARNSSYNSIDISSNQNLPNNDVSEVVDEVINIKASLRIGSNSRLDFKNSLINVWGESADPWLGYAGGVNWNQLNGSIRLINSQVLWAFPGTRRKSGGVNEILGSYVRGSTTGYPFLYLKPQGIIDAYEGRKTYLDGLHVLEISGQPTRIANCIFKNCKMNFINYEAGIIDLRGITFNPGTVAETNGGTFDGWLGAGRGDRNGINFYSCTVRLDRIACVGTPRLVKFWAVFNRFKNMLGNPIEGVRVRYTPTYPSTPAFTINGVNRETYFISAADGYLNPRLLDIPIQYSVNGTSSRNTGIPDPGRVKDYTVETISWKRKIRHPEYQWLEEDFNLTEDIGALDGKEDGEGEILRMLKDEDFDVNTPREDSNAVSFRMENGRLKVVIAPNVTITVQAIYNAFKYYGSSEAGFDITPNLLNIENGVLIVDGDIDVNNATIINPSESIKGLDSTGLITLAPGAQLHVPFSDNNNAGFFTIEGAGTDEVIMLNDRGDIVNSRTGNGLLTIPLANIGQNVTIYRSRNGSYIANTKYLNKTLTTKRGDNGIIKLYLGDEVQIASLEDMMNNLNIINEGIKKATYFPPLPHREDLKL